MAEIQEFQDSHRSEVLGLYREVFGTWSADRFATRWQWQFAANPFVAERRPFIQVAIAEGRVIGHLASFPIPLRLKGQRTIALCASDFVVDRRHPTIAAAMFRSLMRRPPILATGFGATAESMLRASGATLLPGSSVNCTYPLRSTGQLRRALKRRLPWGLGFLAAPVLAKPLSQLWRRTERLPKRDPAPPSPNGLLRPISRFTSEHEALWKDVSADFGGGVDRDARYMNWRYIEGPARSLTLLELRDDRGQLRGITIGGVRADLLEQTPCGTTGVVCELWARPGDAGAARDLAFGILERLDPENVDGIHVPGPSRAIQDALAGIGFVRGESKDYQVAIKSAPPDPQQPAAADPGSYWASAGDGDMLLATML